MLRFAMGLLVSLVAVSGSAAMDIDEASAFLQGTWSSASETWIFSEERWQQFNGGLSVDTTYKIEPMPADMFAVISSETGKRYVVHARPQFKTMTWYPDGSTQQIGFYIRQGD